MTDKSARDEIARHYGAYEIGGSLDDMYESDREHCYDFADRLVAALGAGGFELRKKGALVSWPMTTHETAGQAICAGCGGTIMRAGGGTVYIAGTQWFHSPQCAAMLAASNPKEEGSDN